MRQFIAQNAPFIFVLLWSTGFIGAKWGLPHAAPLTFLSIRYAWVIGLMLILAFLARAKFPRTPGQWVHWGVAGLGIHAFYLGGVFVSISLGLPAGMAALVVGLQPILTAIFAGWFLHERINRYQWGGLIVALIGVAMVVAGKISTHFSWWALFSVVVALITITAGTIYQKKFCQPLDWRSGAVVQFLPTLILTAPIAYLVEDWRVHWTGSFIVALMWLVGVLSIGAISLLNFLIRQGSAVNVASLFYLTPAITAVLAWLLFNETLTLMMMIGMALTILGVLLARQTFSD